MRCRRCDIDMVPGQALISDPEAMKKIPRGVCFDPSKIQKALGRVLKCPQCGRSVGLKFSVDPEPKGAA